MRFVGPEIEKFPKQRPRGFSLFFFNEFDYLRYLIPFPLSLNKLYSLSYITFVFIMSDFAFLYKKQGAVLCQSSKRILQGSVEVEGKVDIF